jgi:serine protease Do
MTGENRFMRGSISVRVDEVRVNEQLAEVAERLRRCTVQVSGAGDRRGSGVIWQSDGLIVTNAHVATSPRQTVRLFDGRSIPAELVLREPRYDLAVLWIAACGLAAAEVRDASLLRTGELVVAVGNPAEANGAFSVGIVSARPGPEDVLVRADIRLAPGNSGGPLADAQGRVVGINSMVMDGFGVAISSMAVARCLSLAREAAAEVA